MVSNSYIDLIISIKNGYLARKETIEVPYSAFKVEILKKLLSLKYIANYKIKKNSHQNLIIDLLYENGVTAVEDVKVYSTPGRRWYASKKELKSILRGRTAIILSTSKGVLSGKEAEKQSIGGELLFEIW